MTIQTHGLTPSCALAALYSMYSFLHASRLFQSISYILPFLCHLELATYLEHRIALAAYTLSTRMAREA